MHMYTATSVTLLLHILATMYVKTCSSDLQDITAQLGENTTLPCQASSPSSIIAVEWTRPDLTSPVFFFMDGRSHKNQQDPSFVDRVDLLDREMKDGNVSLILKNVSSNDTGTYECRVKEKEGRQRRNIIESEPLSVINLTVTDSGPKPGTKSDEENKVGNSGGHVGLTAGLSVAGVIVAAVVFGDRVI